MDGGGVDITAFFNNNVMLPRLATHKKDKTKKNKTMLKTHLNTLKDVRGVINQYKKEGNTKLIIKMWSRIFYQKFSSPYSGNFCNYI